MLADWEMKFSFIAILAIIAYRAIRLEVKRRNLGKAQYAPFVLFLFYLVDALFLNS